METEQIKKLDDIHRAVVGNPLDPDAPPGIIAQLEAHHIALYGCQEQRKKGLIEMVDVLWDAKLKLFAICGAVAVACGFIGWLIPVLLKIGN